MKPFAAEDDGSIIGYMCTTDYECELGLNLHGNKIYPSVESLKEHKSCWEECGIVEVKVVYSKTICDENYSKYLHSDKDEDSK